MHWCSRRNCRICIVVEEDSAKIFSSALQLASFFFFLDMLLFLKYFKISNLLLGGDSVILVGNIISAVFITAFMSFLTSFFNLIGESTPWFLSFGLFLCVFLKSQYAQMGDRFGFYLLLSHIVDSLLVHASKYAKWAGLCVQHRCISSLLQPVDYFDNVHKKSAFYLRFLFVFSFGFFTNSYRQLYIMPLICCFRRLKVAIRFLVAAGGNMNFRLFWLLTLVPFVPCCASTFECAVTPSYSMPCHAILRYALIAP